MRKARGLTLATLIFIISFFMAGHKGVLAAASPTGITVSPAFQQITVATDEAQQPVTFRVTNDKNVPQTIGLSAADFNTLNESGGLFFVGTNPTALQKKYGLAKWFSIFQNQITIGPKQTQVINANILNLPGMAGGGHYGALMIRIVSPGGGDTIGNNVAIDPIASSLMFVTKIGGDTHKLRLANVGFERNLFKPPKRVDLKFANTGNSHVLPRGIVKIVSPSGNLISQGTINENSNIILPESNRFYTVNLREISADSKPGKFKLFVDYRFDGIDQPRGYQTSFWIVPAVWLVIPAIAVAAVTGFGIYFMRRRKLARRD